MMENYMNIKVKKDFKTDKKTCNKFIEQRNNGETNENMKLIKIVIINIDNEKSVLRKLTKKRQKKQLKKKRIVHKLN